MKTVWLSLAFLLPATAAFAQSASRLDEFPLPVSPVAEAASPAPQAPADRETVQQTYESPPSYGQETDYDTYSGYDSEETDHAADFTALNF